MADAALQDAPLFDPYSKDFATDPYRFYHTLRNQAPVYFHPEHKFWAISRYEDVVKAHMDAKTFISSGGVTIEAEEKSSPLLIVKDGKEHAVAKAMMTQLFSASRMAKLDEFIREKAIKHIENGAKKADGGEIDFVSDVSVQLPLEVIGELIGIPEELRPEIHRLSNICVLRGDGVDMAEVNKARMDLLMVYLPLIADRRANPGDDPISRLVLAEVKDEDGNLHSMDDVTLATRFLELGFAGHETVAKAIPNGAMAFMKFPDERRKLQRDMSILPKTIEEIVRYDPPTHLQGRTAARDVELRGETIKAGDRVMLMTGAAVRDPDGFDEPDRFIADREPDRTSFYFGHGVHKCLGVHLARREMTIFFEELFSRFPDFEVFPDRAERKALSNVRGVASLPINFGKHA